MNKKDKIDKVRVFDYIFMFVLVGLVPIIIYGVQYKSPYFDNGAPIIMFDYFNYVKSVVIKVMAVLVVLYETMDFLTTDRVTMFRYEYKEKFGLKHIFCGLIILATLIAFLFSEYKFVALKGAIERFESIWIHFSYIVIFMYSLKFFKKEGAFKVFAYATLFSTFVFGLIGTLQTTKYDPFESRAFLMKTIANKELAQKATITMPGSFSTMYNTNTSGVYALLMLCLLVIIFILIKNNIVRLIVVVDAILATITLVFSLSAATYIALVAATGVAVLLGGIYSLRSGKKSVGMGILGLILVAVIGSLGFVFATYKGQSLLAKVTEPDSYFTDWSQDGNNIYFYNVDDEYIMIKALGNAGYEIYENEKLLVSYNNEQIQSGLMSVENDLVSKVSEQIIIETEKFGAQTIQNYVLKNSVDVQVKLNEYIAINNSQTPKVVAYLTTEEVPYVDFIGFEGHNKLATWRGYIWSRTLPLIISRPFGYGSDVYYEIFPNNDYAGKSFCEFDTNVAVDKPHSIYLNMLANNGILYFVGFMGVVVLTLKEKIKLLFNRDGIKVRVLALILYITGMVAYLVNSLATDNIVIIILIFWIYMSIDNKIFIIEDEKIQS